MAINHRNTGQSKSEKPNKKNYSNSYRNNKEAETPMHEKKKKHYSTIIIHRYSKKTEISNTGKMYHLI
jgi:hypothetical protein